MADLYVSGPVIRPGTRIPEWITGTYDVVFGAAREFDLRVALPERDLELELADPRRFYDSILRRIGESRLAVVVFTGGDVSAGIEASIAANLGKPVVLISDRPEEVPRLLTGLPTVTATLQPGREMPRQLYTLIGRHLRGPATAG